MTGLLTVGLPGPSEGRLAAYETSVAGRGCSALAAAGWRPSARRGFIDAMKSLAVRVLGDFAVDGFEPQALGSRKGRQALHLLARAGGQVVPSDVLADALWADTPPARPEEQISVLLSRMRSVLGRDRIERRDGGYLLRCDWLDAAELAALVDEIGRRRAAGNVVGAASAARVALSLALGAAPAGAPGEWARRRLADLLRFLVREDLHTVIVTAVRTGEGVPLPSTARIHLDTLSLSAVAELVGASRAGDLYSRSRGHPLFLTELAQQSAGSALPASLVESVSARCDDLGTAGALLRAAAVIGPGLDVELLAAVLGRGAVEVLDDAERAVATGLLIAEDGEIRFRHELVMGALAASATAGRRTLLHRQAGRVLARRPGTDPATVAEHARLGGDVGLAADALRDAAARAAERFDHAAAEALLDDAIAMRPGPELWLDRARVRTRLTRYDAALDDAERAIAAGAGLGALEVGAWASYFDRRFADAAQFADDGALAADGLPDRARCLAVGGRIRHAAGDLSGAERLLTGALSVAEGADRVTAAAWLGVLRAHQSRPDEALGLLRPASRGQIGAEHTSATLHALLFLGHAHALAGYPALALDAFTRYTAEVRRRQVPRFAGRAVNFAGWVLRSLGARQEALDHHHEALETGRGHGTAEVTIAALEDLAEQCVDDGDAAGAESRLGEARELLRGDLVFGWRLELKLALLTGRLALLAGDAELAASSADELEKRAAALGVPRYVSVARLLRHRAHLRLGFPVDVGRVAADLDLLDAAVAVEAWWWTGDVAADLGSPALLDRSAERSARLARNAGRYAGSLTKAAERRMREWRVLVSAR
jgi:tetratricopeptide (TPR) repeat protein